eukprot:5976064-Alexandrium_andersonii.AAC.1
MPIRTPEARKRSTMPLALGTEARRVPTFACRKPRTGLFGPACMLGPWPPRAGFQALSQA